MTSANEFRQYGQECREWSDAAQSEHELNSLLEMAATWLVAAARAETTFESKKHQSDSSPA
jgi:hypothetical protein